MKLKKLDPDYVCARCQSLDADTSVVTFCPDCGERRQEPVLRTCAKCAHDFRKGALAEFWREGEPPAALNAAPALTGTPVSQDVVPASPLQAVTQPPAWHPDPAGRWQLRWWDGTRWTEHVASGHSQGVDPL